MDDRFAELLDAVGCWLALDGQHSNTPKEAHEQLMQRVEAKKRLQAVYDKIVAHNSSINFFLGLTDEQLKRAASMRSDPTP